MRGSVHKVAEVALEETVDVIEKVAFVAGVTSATSATNLGTLRASAKKIKIYATAAKVLGISQKTANRGPR